MSKRPVVPSSDQKLQQRDALHHLHPFNDYAVRAEISPLPKDWKFAMEMFDYEA